MSAHATMNDAILSKYPVDVSALSKGSEIERADVERIVGRKFEDRRYALAVTNLCDWIEREMAHRGERVTVASVKGAVRILTDAEAATYQSGRFRSHEAGLRASARKKAQVDRSQLTEAERDKHDRELTVMGAKLTRLKGREATLKPAERQTPGLPGRSKS